MCGISGFFNNSKDKNLFDYNIRAMLNEISHRGPDDEGFFIDEKNDFAIGHRRLSILDLTKNGKQPMQSFNKNYIIVYNGETYNHESLRLKLKKDFNFNNWKSKSDTETILNYIEFFGIQKTLNDIDGMFSMAVWDKQKKILYLSRDLFGEKPLYYGWGQEVFYFASELKSIRSCKGFNNIINSKAISSLFEYSYIASPHSIYENIYKLKPGEIIELKPGVQNNSSVENNPFFKIHKWNSLDKIVTEIKKNNYCYSDSKKIIENSIESRLISDAKLGCFLSGGIDSSLVAAVVSKVSKTKYETFTIGFEEASFDESSKAKKISNYLGLKNNLLILNENKMLEIIPKINQIYDEPFADSSQIPTFLLSQFASQYSKVSLSGDGGDEIFGGYNRYFLTSNIWKIATLIPYNLRNFLFRLIESMSPTFFNFFEKNINLFLPENKKLIFLSEKLKKLSSKIIGKKDKEELYMSFLSEWNLDKISDNLISINYIDSFKFNYINDKTFEENMMFFDTKTYLPDDILTKVDRASMSVGLEVRAPFLSKEILKLSYSLNIDQKIKNNSGKVLLKQILKTYLPDELMNYPKQGFGVPLSSWLKGPLKEWAIENISTTKIINQNYFDHSKVLFFFNEHCKGNKNYASKLWPIIIFCDWYNRYT